MSCNDNNNVYRNSCCPDTPYPNVQHESVPSLIDNLVDALYGEITKTVSGGRVVWDIPCDPAASPAEVPTIPREEGEGLLCYLMRIFQNTVGQYSPFQYWAFTGNGTTTFSLPPSTNTLRSSYLVYLNGVVQPPTAYTISNTSPVNIVFGVAPSNGVAITIVNLGYTPPYVIDVTQSDATPTGSSQTQTVGAWLAYLLAQLATKLTVPTIPPSGLYQLTSLNGTVLWQQFTQLPSDPLPGTKYLTSAGLNAAPTWGTIPKELPALPGGPIQQVLTAPPNGAPAVWQSLPSLSIGPITTQGTTTPRYLEDRFADTVKVEDFGAKGSFKQADTATISNGSNLVTVTGANFTAADLGLIIEIRGAGNANTYIPERQNLRATITQVITGTTVRISANSQANVSNKRVYWGYDDSAAIQAAIDYATTKEISVVEFEPKKYWVNTFKPLTAKVPGSLAGAGVIEIRNGTVNTCLTIRGNGCTIFGTNTTDPNCGQFFAVQSRLKSLVLDGLRLEWDDQRRSNWYTAWAFNMYPVSADRIEYLGFHNCEWVNCQYFGYIRNIFPGPAYQKDTFGKIYLAEWVNCRFLYPYASCILYSSTDPALAGYPNASGQTINLSQWVRHASFLNCYGEGCRDGIIPNDVNGPKDGFNYVCAIKTTFDSCVFKNYAIEVLISEITGEVQILNAPSGYTQPAIGSNVTLTCNGGTFGTPNFNSIATGEILIAFRRGVWPSPSYCGVYESQTTLTAAQVATAGTTITLKRLADDEYWSYNGAESPYFPLAAGTVISEFVDLCPLSLLEENTVTVTGCTFESGPDGLAWAPGPNPRPVFPYVITDSPTFRNKGARGTFTGNMVYNSKWFMDLLDNGSLGCKGATVVNGNVFAVYNNFQPTLNNRSIGIYCNQDSSVISNNVFRYKNNEVAGASIVLGCDYASIHGNKFDIPCITTRTRRQATSLVPSTWSANPLVPAILVTSNNHGFANNDQVFVTQANVTTDEVYGVFTVADVTQNTFKLLYRSITGSGTFAYISPEYAWSAAINFLNPSRPDINWQNISIKDNVCTGYAYLVAGQSGNCQIMDGPNTVETRTNQIASGSDLAFCELKTKFEPRTNGWYRVIYGWETRGSMLGLVSGTVSLMGLEFDVTSSAQNNAAIRVLKNPAAPYSGGDNSLPISKIRLLKAGNRVFLDLYVAQYLHWKDWIGRWYVHNAYASSTKGSLPMCDAKPSLKITAITASGANAVVTSANHGLTVGRGIWISDSNSTPSIDGYRTVASVTQNTFTINGITITSAGTTGEAFDNEFANTTEVVQVDLDKTVAVNLSGGDIQLGAGKIIYGTGVPSAAAPTGSIFIRSDGDHSTTIYVRASGSWKPLAAYDP